MASSPFVAHAPSSSGRRLWLWLAGAVVSVSATVTFCWFAGTALVIDVSVASPDAIVALGSHEWERLPELVDMGKRFPAAKLLLTQPAEVNSYNCHNCGSRAVILQKAGITSSRIVLLPRRVTNTYDEALAVREWALRVHARSIVVVTSPYHTRRALATFRHVLGSSRIVIGVRPAQAHSSADPRHWWGRKHDRWYVAYEWRALLFYVVRYRIWPVA